MIARSEDVEAKCLKINLWASGSAESFNTFSFFHFKFCLQEPDNLQKKGKIN